MSFLERLLRNHPLANILFGVVLLLGLSGYLLMPREQDPEINFNWVNIVTVLSGASAEDVERRVTQPLEDAIKQVADIRFEGDGGTRPVSLERISPAIDRQARSVEARLRFVGEAPAPGAQGRILWRDTQAHLPAEVIVRREGRLGAFVVNDGHARFVPLPNAQEGRPAAVDLPPDTRVVVQGQLVLRDGAPVTDAGN